MTPTPAQLRTLEFIRDYRRGRKNRESPTMQEIAEAFGISKVTVYEHVHHLEAKRLIRMDKHKARSITLTRAGEALFATFPCAVAVDLRRVMDEFLIEPVLRVELEKVLGAEKVGG